MSEVIRRRVLIIQLLPVADQGRNWAVNRNPGASTSTPRIQTIFPSDSTTGQFFRAAPTTWSRSRTSATFLGPRLCRRVTRSPAFQGLKVAGCRVAADSPRRHTPYSGATNLTRDEKRMRRAGCGEGRTPGQTDFPQAALDRDAAGKVEFAAADAPDPANASNCSVCSKLSLAPRRRAAARSTRRATAGCSSRRRTCSMATVSSSGCVLAERPPPRVGRPGSNRAAEGAAILPASRPPRPLRSSLNAPVGQQSGD